MHDRMLATDVPVSPAATVMLIRDGEVGLEVLMLQRNLNAAFARGNWVFPGGRVDQADFETDYAPICDGLDDAVASARLGLDRGGLAWLVAAVRECFEEAGIVLACDAHDPGAAIVRFEPQFAERMVIARHRVHAGELGIADVCRQEGLTLCVDRLLFVDHWLTPLGERRRFDTRFFLAAAPAEQEPLHDNAETIDSVWTTPADALARWERREIRLFPPTIVCLRQLTGHADVATALAAAARLDLPACTTPRLILSDDERVLGVRVPGEPEYDRTPIPTYVIANPR